MKRKFKVLILSVFMAALALIATGCMDKKSKSCDHDYESLKPETTIAATCTEEGEEVYTCAKCGDTKTEVIPKTAHEYGQGREVKAASCTEEGLKVYTCLGCERTKEEVIKKTMHRAQGVEMVAPTCETDGYTSYTYCLDCNTYLTKKQVLPAFGHTPVALKGIAATCTEDGLTSGSECTDCGKVLEEQKVILAKGHTITTVAGQSPTCTVDGKSAGSYCSACDTVFKAQEVIPALGHEYGDDNTCDMCGQHRHTEVVLPAVAATCTEAGRSEGIQCSECLIILQAQSVIPAFGHDIGENGVCQTCGMEHEHRAIEIAAIAPTCSSVGYTAGSKCSDCGKIILEPQEIAKLAHTERALAAVAATCSRTGLTAGVDCSVCGEILTAQEVVPMDSSKHTYNADKVCQDCGYVYVSQGLEIDDTGVLTGIGTCTDTELYIPAIYNGDTVSVGEGAFEGNTTITKVVFRGDVKVYSNAFNNCSELTTVIFSGLGTLNNTKEMAKGHAFSYCPKLATVYAESGLISYISKDPIYGGSITLYTHYVFCLGSGSDVENGLTLIFGENVINIADGYYSVPGVLNNHVGSVITVVVPNLEFCRYDESNCFRTASYTTVVLPDGTVLKEATT